MPPPISSASLAPVDNTPSSNPTSPAQCRRKSSVRVEPPPFPHSAWTVGLFSGHGRYLTAEAFGNKLNMSGTTLKKKQFWTLIQELGTNQADSGASHSSPVYLRSPQDKYLSIDRSGNVSCFAEIPGPEQKFTLVFNGEHRCFHILSMTHAYYLSASPAAGRSTASQDGYILQGVNKPTATDGSEFWSLRLHVHPPSINLRHVNRERYVKTHGDIAQGTEALPWGPEALFTLEISSPASNPSTSTYALKSHDGRYVGPDGVLCSSPSRGQFTLFFVQGYLALRDAIGGAKFLSAVGNDGVLKCKRDTVTKEELWTVTGSYPQINFLAPNEKFVSAQRGLDIAANQDEKTESETFQLENDLTGKYWRFRTIKDKYWSTGDNGGIQISQDAASGEVDKTLYDIIWLPDGRIGIRALSNNKFITLKINRHLFATSIELGEREKFKLLLANRSSIVLQGPEGYVGENKAIEGPLDTGKNVCEPTFVEQPSFDTYHLKTLSGLYWHLNEGNMQVTAQRLSDGKKPQRFFIIFKERSKIIIQAPNEKYLKLGSRKKLEASEENQSHAVIWNI